MKTWIYLLWTMLLVPGVLAQTSEQGIREQPVWGAFAEPTLSPDGRDLVFVCQGDLWQVSAGGGVARRLTAMPGEESRPRISPEGRYLAFQTTVHGKADVALLDRQGGSIRLLTVHSGEDRLSSWAPDGRTVLFSSERDGDFVPWRVPVQGGTPTRVWGGGYFARGHDVLEDALGRGYWFCDSWESYHTPWRRGYRGAFQPDIRLLRADSGALESPAPWEGKDIWPSQDQGGQLYFVSDRGDQGTRQICRLSPDGTVRVMTSLNRPPGPPQAAWQGGGVVFTVDGVITVMSGETGTLRSVPVRCALEDRGSVPLLRSLDGHIAQGSLSTDGVKLALVAWGSLWVGPAEGGRMQLLKLPDRPEISEAHWMVDARHLVVGAARDGWTNWWVVDASGQDSARQVTHEPMTHRGLCLEPRFGRFAVYLRGRTELMRWDFSTGKHQLLVRGSFWPMDDDRPALSPGGDQLLLSPFEGMEQDLLLVNLRDGSYRFLSRTAMTERRPFWSASGETVYFESDPRMPRFPAGAEETRVYRLPLTVERSGTDYRNFDRLWKSTPVGAPEPQPFRWEGLEKRWEVLGGEETGLKLLGVLPLAGGGDALLTVFAHRNPRELGLLQIRKGKPVIRIPLTGLKGKVSRPQLLSSQPKSMVINGGRLYLLDGGTHTLKYLAVQGEDERPQNWEYRRVLERAWASLAESFYDGNLHWVDWTWVGDRYRDRVKGVASREDLARLLEEMTGELGASHVGVHLSADPGDVRRLVPETLEPGIVFEASDPWVVHSLLPDGPAQAEGVDVRPGDRLLAVDGEAVRHGENRWQWFTSARSRRECRLLLQRGEARLIRDVGLVNAQTMRNLYQGKNEAQARRRVLEQAGGRVAYIALRTLSEASCEAFLREMASEGHRCEGLIIDLRNNRGGNRHDQVLQVLERRAYARWKFREGKLAAQPDLAPASKPMALLVNAQTLSDGEMLAAGFQALRLGPVVGGQTYGWLIFTANIPLFEGSMLKLPAWGCATLNGKNIEKTGVRPDVAVSMDLTDLLADRDPQLDAALAWVRQKMEKPPAPESERGKTMLEP